MGSQRRVEESREGSKRHHHARGASKDRVSSREPSRGKSEHLIGVEIFPKSWWTFLCDEHMILSLFHSQSRPSAAYPYFTRRYRWFVFAIAISLSLIVTLGVEWTKYQSDVALQEQQANLDACLAGCHGDHPDFADNVLTSTLSVGRMLRHHKMDKESPPDGSDGRDFEDGSGWVNPHDNTQDGGDSTHTQDGGDSTHTQDGGRDGGDSTRTQDGGDSTRTQDGGRDGGDSTRTQDGGRDGGDSMNGGADHYDSDISGGHPIPSPSPTPIEDDLDAGLWTFLYEYLLGLDYIKEDDEEITYEDLDDVALHDPFVDWILDTDPIAESASQVSNIETTVQTLAAEEDVIDPEAIAKVSENLTDAAKADSGPYKNINSCEVFSNKWKVGQYQDFYLYRETDSAAFQKCSELIANQHIIDYKLVRNKAVCFGGVKELSNTAVANVCNFDGLDELVPCSAWDRRPKASGFTNNSTNDILCIDPNTSTGRSEVTMNFIVEVAIELAILVPASAVVEVMLRILSSAVHKHSAARIGIIVPGGILIGEFIFIGWAGSEIWSSDLSLVSSLAEWMLSFSVMMGLEVVKFTLFYHIMHRRQSAEIHWLPRLVVNLAILGVGIGIAVTYID